MTTTLQSLGLTLAGGSVCFLLSFVLFSVGIWARTSFLAPRATARPPAVIFNRLAEPGHVQYRGNPMTGWIPWTLSLTYDTLLRGVPGTGTRKGGLAGKLLQVNLDGIVLLRFHALGLRVAGMATFLCLVILLPTYMTAGCYEDPTLAGCLVAPDSSFNLTNYERTTIANVPAEVIDDIRKVDLASVKARLYMAVIVYWLLCAYTCWQLQREWVEILAMRRVYYLEHDVWGDRQEELRQTLLYKETNPSIYNKSSSNNNSNTDFDAGEEH